MTFVAQTYEQFVDDLLTALTGGMVREEHQFLGTEETYSLASPGAIRSTIRVFGQQNETFTLFQREIDYEYTSEEAVVKWIDGGNTPDELSHFYVNYYLEEGRRRLTDRNPGSVTTILAEAFAREFAVLHKQMEFIYRSAFVDLSTGASLEHVAALLGLTRKDAKFATGEVLFKRSTPAPGDITIPAGTLVSTTEGQNFETTNKRTIRKGQLSTVVPIRAQLEGPPGKIEVGKIVNINRLIFGVDSVINEGPTFFASEKETDDEFRRRIKGTLERAGKATVNAIKYGLIEEVAEISEHNIQLIEHSDEPGLVEVKLGLESNGDAKLVRRIEESIFNSRAAGIRVKHNLPTRTPLSGIQQDEVKQSSPSQEIGLQRGGENGRLKAAVPFPQKILDQMPEGILLLRVEVLLRLTEANLSAAQKESIEDDSRNQVLDYIDTLPMGAQLIFNKLLGRIVGNEKILDVDLAIGALTGETWFREENLSTQGRKAQIDLESIFVSLMEETVFIDVLVQLEPANNKPASASEEVETPESNAEEEVAVPERGETDAELEEDLSKPSVKVTQELYTTVESAINRTLASVEGELTKTQLRSALRSEIQSFGIQFIAKDGVVINAEYEETGRLLKNTEAASLQVNQVPQLRDLSIKIPGVLDA